MLDLLIKNARIVDGTGMPAYFSHVGIRDGKIAVIAPVVKEEAKSVLDAKGLTLTPGFIDSHSHDDMIMETVPASRFNPRPKVDSALVKITPRKAPFDVMDEKTFFKVTEVTFNHRRKKIGTSLKSAHMIQAGDDIPFLDERIENLRPVEIGQIADAVFQANSSREA